jgi:pSer/pThr/pTyr-binding forkhead associated (FHA) protein
LLKIDRPKETYMILEEAGKARRDMIVIQNVPSDGIKIGRGHQCDIRVTDISVSRVHAFIKLINGKFVLFDNESKFGTLVKLQRDIQINFEKKAFQIGRTVLTFKMKKPKLQREQSNEPMDIELENILKHI